MFDHVTIRAADRGASERFYDTVLAPLGVEKTHSDEHYVEWGDLSLTQADDEHPPTRGLLGVLRDGRVEAIAAFEVADAPFAADPVAGQPTPGSSRPGLLAAGDEHHAHHARL